MGSSFSVCVCAFLKSSVTHSPYTVSLDFKKCEVTLDFKKVKSSFTLKDRTVSRSTCVGLVPFLVAHDRWRVSTAVGQLLAVHEGSDKPFHVRPTYAIVCISLHVMFHMFASQSSAILRSS